MTIALGKRHMDGGQTPSRRNAATVDESHVDDDGSDESITRSDETLETKSCSEVKLNKNCLACCRAENKLLQSSSSANHLLLPSYASPPHPLNILADPSAPSTQRGLGACSWTARRRSLQRSRNCDRRLGTVDSTEDQRFLSLPRQSWRPDAGITELCSHYLPLTCSLTGQPLPAPAPLSLHPRPALRLAKFRSWNTAAVLPHPNERPARPSRCSHGVAPVTVFPMSFRDCRSIWQSACQTVKRRQ